MGIRPSTTLMLMKACRRFLDWFAVPPETSEAVILGGRSGFANQNRRGPSLVSARCLCENCAPAF
jgi:hypothetical protein